MALPDAPYTRGEMYLNAIATGDASGIPSAPHTREEMYLDAIAKGGGGGGGSSGGGVTTYYITWDDVAPKAWAYKNEALSETVTVNEMIDAYTGGEIRFVMKYDGTVLGVYSCVEYNHEQDDAFMIAFFTNDSFAPVRVFASSTRLA